MDKNAWVYKDDEGQKWFVGIYTNNFKDREDETLTWDAHLEFAQWVKDTGVTLPVTVIHQPKYPAELHAAMLYGLMKGIYTAEEYSKSYMKLYKAFAFAQTEAIIPINGFVLVVAKILKDKEDAVKLLNKSGWGMSHGFLTLDRDESTIHKYRSFELTTLPPIMAANWMTVSSIKEIFDMDAFKTLADEDRKKLESLLKADPADLEEGLGEFQRILSTFVSSKELDGAEEEDAQEEEVVEDVYEQTRDKLFADFGMDQLNKAFVQVTEALQDQDKRLKTLDERLKSAERSEDEKVADAFFTPNWDSWDKAAVEEEPSDEEKEELKETALGNKGIEGVGDDAPTDNPLYFGWMKPMGLGEQY